MSATISLGVSRIILLGGAIAVLVAAGAFIFKMPKPAAAHHDAVLAVPAQPIDPAILTTGL